MFLCLFPAFALSLELAPPKPIFVIGKPAESSSDKPDHVLFSPDGKRLYSTGQVGFIEASDALTGKSLLSIRTGEKWLGAIGLNPQGTRLASSHGDRVKVWDTATANEVLSFTAWPGNSVPCLAFDRTGTQVACPTAPDKVTVWELSTGRPVSTFQRELKTDNTRDYICNLAYSPDGNSLAAADTATEYVTVWSTTSGKVRFTLHVKDPGHVWDFGIADCKVAFSPGGRQIATAGSENDDIRVWDAATGKRLHSFKGGKTMAFTADSRYLATLAPISLESKADAKGGFRLSECSGEIRVLAVASGKQVISLKVPGASAISEMAFQPRGKHLATAHRDGTVKVWDDAGVWRGEKSF